jgi:hypothetical protein
MSYECSIRTQLRKFGKAFKRNQGRAKLGALPPAGKGLRDMMRLGGRSYGTSLVLSHPRELRDDERLNREFSDRSPLTAAKTSKTYCSDVTPRLHSLRMVQRSIT